MRIRGGQGRRCSECLIPTTQPGCKHQSVLLQEIRKKFQIGSDVLIPKASVALVLMGVFNLQASTGNAIMLQKAGLGNSLIEGENLLSHVSNESTRKYILLDLLFVNRQGAVGDEAVRGYLGCSPYGMV